MNKSCITHIWFVMIICLPQICFCQNLTKKDSIDKLIQDQSDLGKKVELLLSGIKQLNFKSSSELEKYSKKAFAICQELQDLDLIMQLLKTTGEKFITLKAGDIAYEKFEELEKLAQEKNVYSYQAFAKFGFAQILQNDNNLNEAISLFQEGVDIADKGKAYSRKADGLFQIARIYRTLGKPKEAISFLDQCEQALDKEMDVYTYLESLNLRGRVYRSTGDLDSARTTYSKVIKLAIDKNEDGSLSRAYNNLGNIEQLQGNFDEAISYYIKSLRIKEKQNNKRGITLAHYNIGTIKHSMKDYIGANENFRKSQNLAREIDYAKVVQLSELKIGNCYHEMNQLDSAIVYHLNALEMAEAGKDKNGIALCYLNLSEDYSKLKDFSQGFTYAQKALTIAKETKNVSYEGAALSMISTTYLELSEQSDKNSSSVLEQIQLDDRQLLSYLNRAKTIAQETGHYENLSISLEGLSFLHKTTNDYKAQSQVLEEYITLKDTLFSSERTKAISEWETKYNTAEKEKEITQLEAAEERSSARIRLWTTASLLLFAILALGSFMFLQLQKAKRKLAIQNEKLIDLNLTKDRFFGIIAHDIRSPIVALESVDDQMDYYLKKENTSKLTQLGGLVGKTARHLNSLLDNLLNWALIQTNGMSYNPERIDLANAFEEVTSLLEVNLKMKNIILETNFPKELSIKADSPSFKTILRNTLSNAIKFSYPNSKIKLDAKKTSQGALFSVKDQGVGIPKDKIANLFTLDKKSASGTAGEKGTGLGLILCKGLVELNKGEISIKSEEGVGTTISFTIPDGL